VHCKPNGFGRIAQPQGNDLNAIVFSDMSNGIAVGSVGTILKTTDGGISWYFNDVPFQMIYMQSHLPSSF
jgi:photosystem II stability/assembly factor-like uncharacterized protein